MPRSARAPAPRASPAFSAWIGVRMREARKHAGTDSAAALYLKLSTHWVKQRSTRPLYMRRLSHARSVSVPHHQTK